LNNFYRKEKKKKKKPTKRSKQPSVSSSSSGVDDSQSESSGDQQTSVSSSSSSSTQSPPQKKKKKQTKKHKKKKTVKSHKKDQDLASSDTPDSLGDIDDNERERIETHFEMYNEIYPREDRPANLQRKSVVGRYTLDELMRYQTQIQEREKKDNLGEEVFTKDAKPPKTKYKKKTDDGKKRLHTARWNRLPLVPPKEYYKKTPKKRNAVIRNFPTEHYGITGQVSEATIGQMHNRSVKVTLCSFCKSTYKPAKAGEKAGKYADLFQLMEGIVNYGIILHALWPYDYTGWTLLKVLCEVRWGETANLVGR
jgi:hypothetical protein